ncbi:MAG: hypothetical protein ACP5O2_04630 [Bacteroidales bacterium]
MNTTHSHPDQLLRQIFAAVPMEEPAEGFTEQVLQRIPSVQPGMNMTSEAPFNMGFRALLALVITIGFFALWIFTRDFSFTDGFLRVFGLLFNDFSLSSIRYLMQNLWGQIMNIKLWSMLAGTVFLTGGALMVIYRLGDDRKNMGYLGNLVVFW